MYRLTGTDFRRAQRLGTWPPQIRVATVVAVCLIVEAIVAKNVIHVKLNVVAQFAPLWVFAACLPWFARDKASEIATMILAIGATAGVLVFYAL